ncbi:endodeoxyribonuclease RUS [compost metagenome]
MTVTLHLPFPISVNAAYANGGHKRGRHKTARYNAWIAEASLHVRDRHRQNIGAYQLAISLEAPDRRTRDLANHEKVLSDFLVMHGVIQDDSKCQQLVMTWGKDLPAPCVVTVTEAAQEVAA